MDGQMDEWMDGWADGWTDGHIHTQRVKHLGNLNLNLLMFK